MASVRPLQPQESSNMGLSLLQAVAALMSTCTRRLSRAARRLQLRPGVTSSCSSRTIVPFLGGGGKKVMSSKKKAAGEEGSFDGEDGVWRKEILMGEKCQPLDFSGAIYYDAEGRRLAQPPPPRSPMRSPLPSSYKLSANAGGY